MSLGGAMNTAVSALNAQSQQLAMISENLANSSTTGYKTVTGGFATLLNGQSTSKYSSGGVTVYTKQNVTAQGQIQSTSTTTDMAIDGNGMFCVSYNKDTSDMYFSRDGSFTEDNEGYLTLNGKYYLEGWPTDSNGNVTSSDTSSVSGLEAVNLNTHSTSAAGTTTYTLAQNLPADATVNASFSTSLSIYDSLGVAETVPATWTKTAANTWTVSLSNPTNSSGTTSGTIGGNTTYTLNFTSAGALSSITDSGGTAVTTPTITVSSWTSGASASSISFNLGASGSASGLTQFSSGSTTPTIDKKSSSQDGYAYGRLTGVTVGTDGTITAKYDNGQTIPIYKVPIATFNNVDGLSSLSDNVYQMTSTSGSYTLHTAGSGGSGKIDGSSLESSGTDTANELSLMIVAQQAYSAASQIISTSKSMFDDLMQVAR
jgi:flagellar hook protein FlgE